MQKSLWARQAQGTVDISPAAAHPQTSLSFLEMPLGLWEHQNSEAMTSYPYMLKALAYFLGPRYPLRTPSVADLNYRNSGWVWWRVQYHSKDCPQTALVRSHSLHKKGFSPGMHGLIHGATVLSLDGRYPHFILLKPTQPHPRKKVNKRTFSHYSTRHCGRDPISRRKEKKGDAHPPESRDRIFHSWWPSHWPVDTPDSDCLCVCCFLQLWRALAGFCVISSVGLCSSVPSDWLPKSAT